MFWSNIDPIEAMLHFSTKMSILPPSEVPKYWDELRTKKTPLHFTYRARTRKKISTCQPDPKNSRNPGEYQFMALIFFFVLNLKIQKNNTKK